VIAARAAIARADEPAPLARVAVVVLPASADDKPLGATRAATVQVSMEHALTADARLTVVDLDEGLAESGGAAPTEAVAEARALVADGEELLRRGQAKAALQKLEGAAPELAKILAWTQKQELAHAQFLRGAAHAALGDDKTAIDEFVELLVWRPDFAADPSIAPGKVIPLWEKAQARARRLPGGAVELASTPAGAMAYADGRFVGFTPTTIEALAIGTHYLTVRARGCEKAVVAVRISDKKPATEQVTLTPSPRAAQLDADVVALRAGLGTAQAPAEMQATLGDLSDLLGVDQIVVLVAPPTGADEKRYKAFVYGAVGGMRLAQAEIVVGDQGLDDALGQLAVELYKQVSFAPPPPPPPPPRHVAHGAPFWRRWWFWSGVGAAALGVAAGAIIVHERDSGPVCPAGDSCGAVLFRF
jgi:tetratricopeptide (TPR) repeat protein